MTPRIAVRPPRQIPVFIRVSALLLLLAAAWLATTTPAAARDSVAQEIECLALNIYFEARGESRLGQRAVGHVVLNRVADKRFPATICEVVRQGGENRRHRCQFSWWCDGRSDDPEDRYAWDRSKAMANLIYWGFDDDPTYGALWYHTLDKRPIWRHALMRGPAIGSHVFYLRETKRQRTALQTASY